MNIAILGPTALGKSNIAIELAKKIDAEIISCDSMQIYKDLNIGTGTIIPSKMFGIKHHLINEFDLHQRYNASIFKKLAEEKIQKIKNRQKKLILVGGTGMYAYLFLYQKKMLPANKSIYQKLWHKYQKEGIKPLLEEIQNIDPKTAEKVSNNPRRILRMLEVIRITGKVITYNEEKKKIHPSFCEYILLSSPEYNRKQIIIRCKKMLANGWVEETKKVISKGIFQSPTAWQALGYKTIQEFIRGKISTKEKLLEKLITLTYRYAKKQRTWFKNKHSQALFLDREKMAKKEIIQKIISSYRQLPITH